jgi:small subunit ribosomal protein S6
MAAETPTYDLMLMLDPAATDEQRAKVLADVERLLGQDGGTIVGTQEWGTRTMAYEIRHKTDAEYHLFQFQAPADTLRALERMLRITDAVVRFRIIKLAPGTPPPPAVRPESRAAEESPAPAGPAPAATPA